jgi:uridine kinase
VVGYFAGLEKPLAAAVRDAARHQGPAFVGLDGPGCAGKSTLADALAQLLPNATVVSLDDFFVPLAEQVLTRSSDENLAVGIPHLRWSAIEALFRDLASGRQASYDPYVWGADKLGAPVRLLHCDFIVVEGLYALHPNLSSSYSFKIWVDCLTTHRMARVENRMHGYDVTDRERWLDLWRSLYVPREQHYLATFRPHLTSDLFVAGAGLDHGTQDSFAWTHSVARRPTSVCS